MASEDAFKQRRPGRKLTKKKREPGKISMDIPERFKHDDDEEDQDELELTRNNSAFMHQSIFGVIAAAQSKTDVQSVLQESGSDTEDDQVDDPRQAKGVEQKPAYPNTHPSSSPDHPVSRRKRFTEHKLLRSLPGIKSKPSGIKSGSSSTPQRTSSARNSPASSAVPAIPSPLSRDAPVMSQMLQARANVEDLYSSEATLKGGRSKDADMSASQTSHKAPLALPEALKEIFQFDEPEEVISEYPCWFLQSVLLQGYMYITQRHICFYAYLHQKSNVTIKSGYIAKRGKNNPHYRRYWFVLKGTVLSYYTDPSTPYFPSGNVDLRYGISAELVKDKDKSKDATFFSVTTDKRTYSFKADSAPSAKEWVKQLQKVIFRSHNDGDSVKISLPIDNILDVEENPVIDFAETIKIRVIDNDETFAVDEYFFSFFSFGKDAMNVLRIMTQDTSASKALIEDQPSPQPEPADRRASHVSERSPRMSTALAVPGLTEHVRATIAAASASGITSPRSSIDIARSSLDVPRRSLDVSRSSFDRPRRSASAASRVSFDHSSRRARSPMALGVRDLPGSHLSSSQTVSADDTDPESRTESDASASRILSGSGVFHDPTLKHPQPHKSFTAPAIVPRLESTDRLGAGSHDRSGHHHQELPLSDQRSKMQEGRSSGARPRLDRKLSPAIGTVQMEQGRKSSYSESLGGLVRAGTDIASLLGKHGKRMSSMFAVTPMGYYEKVYGMWAGGKKHYSDADGLQSEDHVYDPDEEADTLQAEARFREHFALPNSEKLVASYFAHLLRVYPQYGKIYIGNTRLCFRSMLPGTRTKLVIPFKDILNVDKEKGLVFGYSGMVVVIRGHEEVFFQFSASGLRDDCTVTVLRSLETVKRSKAAVGTSEDEFDDAGVAAREHEVLEKARKDGYAEHDLQLPRNIDTIGQTITNDTLTDESFAYLHVEPGVPAILFDDPEASVLDFKPQESLHITCLTIGSRGDVQPYIALCKGLLKEGHKPRIATHAEFEPWVRKHGIDFAPVEGDPAELMQICVENGMFTPSFLYEANSKFRGFVDTLLTTAWTACQGSDLLIESPSAMAGIHIAEALGIPYFRAFTMPWTRTRAYPHAFAVPNHKMGGAYNYMTYVLFDNIFWQSTAAQVNRWRRKVLGLRPTNLDKLQPNKVPFLYNFSPSVVVPPLDFSDWIRVTGYWFLDEAITWTPAPELLAFIKKARDDKVPLVYIGFGSVVVSDSAQMTRNIIAAVLKADVRCILSKGWSDRLEKKTDVKTGPEVPLPPSIYQISSAPHDWLFKQIDAAVHHGGAGTTGASLRAGVPTIIRPFFGDQFFFGNRVQDLGVGMHIKRVTENTLGKALWIACHDERMREKANILGDQIRKENGVETAIKAIYRDMEYAKTLVKKRDWITKTGAAPEDDNDGDGEEEKEGNNLEDSWTVVDNDPHEAMMQSQFDLRRAAAEPERRVSGDIPLGNLALRGR